MRKIKYVISSCMIVAFIGCFLNMGAQTTTSTIEGTVTDPNGAVIAGAKVSANGTTLATERNVVTDSDGYYRLTALPAGSYTVTISQQGFTTGVYQVELTLNRVANCCVIRAAKIRNQISLVKPVDYFTGISPVFGCRIKKS